MYLHIGVWASTETIFENMMKRFGLASVVKGEVVYHRDQNISGPFSISIGTGTFDDDGFEIMNILPGLHWNIRAYHDLKDLLTRHPQTDKRYDEFENEVRKNLLDRSAFFDMVGIPNAARVPKGMVGNAKIPGGLELPNFRIFDLSDLATPYNVWA